MNIINYFCKNKSNIFLTILFVVIVNILLKSEILYDFIWGSQYGLFGDYKECVNWLKRNYLGFDVFQVNNGFHRLNYGPIL